MPLIEVKNLVKEYKIKRKETGIKGAIKGLFSPDKKIVRGVDGISFEIERGEMVGYIGPNGAGKSTTIKMLAGILHPTLGEIKIDGVSPQENRKTVVKNLGVVFGQRTQLYWDLRLGESFELIKRIYRIKDELFHENMELLSNLLGLNEIIDIPVRQLSLGQRMKGDIAAAMLHSPTILFLDEPTIGLDADAKLAVRRFILEVNKLNQTTIILTTHDLDDLQFICNRLIVVNHGKIVEDGPLEKVISKLAPYRLLIVELNNPSSDLHHPNAEIIKIEGLSVWYKFNKDSITAAELIKDLSQKIPIRDLSVKEPDIEDAIREVYRVSNN